MSDVDSEAAAAEARRRIRPARPTHRSLFLGSPRKLKSTKRSKYRMKKVGHNRWIWVLVDK